MSERILEDSREIQWEQFWRLVVLGIQEGALGRVVRSPTVESESDMQRSEEIARSVDEAIRKGRREVM